MSNTGYKQATIAYRVSKPGGEPLDVDGNLTRLSGKKQAIAVLVGFDNPDPAKYEIDFYFDKDGAVSGNPTVTRDITACPFGYIRISPEKIQIGDPDITATFTLESSNNWHLLSGPLHAAVLDYTAGAGGKYTITATGRGIGEGYFTFINDLTGQTTTIFISVVGFIRITPTRIILEGENATASFELVSSSKWHLAGGPTDKIEVSDATGDAGTYTITVKGVAVGGGYFTFVNEANQQIATVYIAYVSGRPWVLEDGTWNMLGFWYNDGIWRYE